MPNKEAGEVSDQVPQNPTPPEQALLAAQLEVRRSRRNMLITGGVLTTAVLAVANGMRVRGDLNSAFREDIRTGKINPATLQKYRAFGRAGSLGLLPVDPNEERQRINTIQTVIDFISAPAFALSLIGLFMSLSQKERANKKVQQLSAQNPPANP